jgi:hypothetical protein
MTPHRPGPLRGRDYDPSDPLGPPTPHPYFEAAGAVHEIRSTDTAPADDRALSPRTVPPQPAPRLRRHGHLSGRGEPA